MSPEEIKGAVQQCIPDATVEVKLDGNHVSMVVVSRDFEGLNLVKRQQSVYAALSEAISTGVLHAVNMETFTPSEWDKARPFRGS